MLEVRPRFLEPLDCVVPGNRAETQPVDLWEDVPHPVRALLSTGELPQRLFVVLLLRPDETFEVVGVSSHGAIRTARPVALVPGYSARRTSRTHGSAGCGRAAAS